MTVTEDSGERAARLQDAAKLGPDVTLIPMHDDPDKPVVADATEKWWVVDKRTRDKRAVLLYASQVDPGQVADAAKRQRSVLQRMSHGTAKAVLQPLETGECEGRSFSVFPYHIPLSGNRLRRKWQVRRLREPLLGWLNDVVRETAQTVEGDDLHTAFVEPLRSLVRDDLLRDDVRDRAQYAVSRIENGEWRPRAVVTHNDLWLDNVLLAPQDASGGYGFVVIDWGLSNPYGPPFYDLMRLLRSLRLGPGPSRKAIEDHAVAVGCQSTEAINHLLAGLGWLRQNLNNFPHHRFLETAHRCIDHLDRALI